MWGYGQCLDTIKGIVMELNSLFSMLIELLTNDSLLQSATNTVPDLVSAIKATSLTLCVMFFLIDFFTKTLHFQWVTWENVMIYLRLFLNFLMIGALSFGGGYGMVSLVRERVLSNGWLTENEFLNFIAVSESTPGPLAVNMATFIGSTQGGILGSFVATLGVVLPSFLIILLIASALKNLMKYAPVNAFLSGVRPCVVAMILATALSMALSTLFGLTDLQAGFAPDLRSIAVFAMLGATHLICKIIRKTAPSPILMILFSAGLGILFW